MLREIHQLEEIALQCRSGGNLNPQLANWLGSCLDEFLTRPLGHMDEAFGIRTGRGGVPWRMERALRVRDAALRSLARRLDPNLSLCARSRAIVEMSNRYAASAWRFDQSQPEMPPCYRGTMKEDIWAAFKSGAPMPIGERRLRGIIAD